MKIAFIIDVFPSLSETFILDQITGILDAGHDVTIFSASRGDMTQIHPETAQYCLMERTHYHNEAPGGRWMRLVNAVPIFRRHMASHFMAMMHALNFFCRGMDALSLRWLYKMDMFLAFGPFDIMMCHFGHNGNLAVALRQMGVPGKIVTMFHGYDLRRAEESNVGMYRKLFDDGDLFLAISNYTVSKLKSLGLSTDKIMLHPVGINTDRFSLRWDDHAGRTTGGPVRILTVARLSPEKGLDHGIRAVGMLVRAYPDMVFEYEIIGGGAIETKLRDLVRELRLEGVVTFAGPRSRPSVMQSLAKAHLFLLPSNADVLPVCIMEAMATGIPVVATSVGAVPEIVADGYSGLLVPPGDEKAMAKALGYLVDHLPDLPKMGKVGREIVKNKFNTAILNHNLIKIYQKIIHGHA